MAKNFKSIEARELKSSRLKTSLKRVEKNRVNYNNASHYHTDQNDSKWKIIKMWSIFPPLTLNSRAQVCLQNAYLRLEADFGK